MKHLILLLCFLVIATTCSFAQFTNVAVTTNSYDQSEPTIATSPLNSNYSLAAWNDFRIINGNDFSKAGYAFTTNNGTNWTEKILSPPSTYTNAFDPSVSYDHYGNMFYCYIASTGGLGPVYVSRTTNLNNEDWNDQQVSTLTTYQDKPFMAVDNTGGSKDGRIYVSWTDFSSSLSTIKFSYSTNHGVSFSTPVIIGSLAENPGTYPYLMPKSATAKIGDPGRLSGIK